LAVVNFPRFKVVFEEEAGEFIFSLPKRKGRRLLDIAHVIADDPFAAPDYTLPDAS
jgi:hypothetical protein